MRAILAALATLALATAACADVADAPAPVPATVTERYSYVVGAEVARSFQRDGVHIDVAAFTRAMRDVFGGAELAMTADEMRRAVADRQAQERAERAQVMAEKKQEEDAFLAGFREREGVRELAHGVLYRVLEAGTGDSPDTDSEVTVHYEGTLMDGTVFDSTHQRGEPARLDLERVISGWQVAIPLMREGARWEIAVPAAQAYGSRGAGGVIGPGEPLVFEVELIEVH